MQLSPHNSGFDFLEHVDEVWGGFAGLVGKCSGRMLEYVGEVSRGYLGGVVDYFRRFSGVKQPIHNL